MLLLINAVVYFLFGLAFIAYPQTVSVYLLDSGPTTANAITDMRAMYGGICVALAIVLFQSSRDKALKKAGTGLLLAITCGLVFGRSIGLMIDGGSKQMFMFLVVEILVVILAYRDLVRLKKR